MLYASFSAQVDRAHDLSCLVRPHPSIITGPLISHSQGEVAGSASSSPRRGVGDFSQRERGLMIEAEQVTGEFILEKGFLPWDLISLHFLCSDNFIQGAFLEKGFCDPLLQ